MQLGARQPDGASLREHLQSGAAQTGRADPRLLAAVPAAGAALWQAFIDLASARPAHMGGAGAIPPSELQAWQQLHGLRLSPWEIDTLAAMDRAALAAMAEHGRKGSKP